MNSPNMKSFALLSGMAMAAGLMILQSCTKDPVASSQSRVLNLPEEVFKYSDDVEEAQRNIHTFNWSEDPRTIDNNVATLGRVLFYDPVLSRNNRTSCASCHKQSLAFADPIAKSEGFVKGETRRNSLSIQNTFVRSPDAGFFWDGRASTLEEQVLMPVEDHVEMGMRSTEDLVTKLKSVDYYAPLFEKAYGSENVSEEGIRFALTEFVSSITSFNSKYDEGRFTDFTNFSAQEKRGYELFMTELPCGSCHQDGSFENYAPSVIGLDPEYADKGRGEWDESGSYDGAFLTPTLRNIELTGPYMHDGRYETLEEVIEFYNSGVQDHENLDYRLRDFDPEFGSFEDFNSAKPRKFNLTPADKDALIAFLKTLTDEYMITDQKLSDPFVMVDVDE